MVAGEFVEVYGQDQSRWDAVLACFFLDTAPNIMEYLEIIYAMLRPGGFLINFGPLLYHWQDAGSGDGMDSRYGQSVELSYQEIRHVMQTIGFVIRVRARSLLILYITCMNSHHGTHSRFQHEATSPTSYCRNVRSMMSTQFTGICFVAQKPGPESDAFKAAAAASAATTTGAGAGVGAGAGAGAGAMAGAGTGVLPTPGDTCDLVSLTCGVLLFHGS